MRNQLRLPALATAVAAACSAGTSIVPVRFDDFGSSNGMRIEVVTEGGIAALAVNHRATHDDRTFTYSQRHICSTTCSPPMDSASGTLSPASTDSLFNIVIEQLRFVPKDDYGTTPNAADMMSYTVRVTAASATRAIHADDGTMPPALRTIVDVVRGTIVAARR